MREIRPVDLQAAIVLATTAVAAVAGWWLTVVAFSLPSYVLPPPDAVAAHLAANPEIYLRNAWYTFEKVLYGGTVGVLAGITIAVGIAHVPWLRRAIYPYVVTARVLPKVAIAPVLLIYLGTGMVTAVVFVALVAFFPAVLSTVAGFERTPTTQRDLFASVDASWFETLLRVRFPYALPDVIAGVKQSMTLAVVGAVVAEWVVADSGLGFLILIASENVRADVMVAALAVLFVEGLAIYGIVHVAARRVRWR